jgi:hypothetical protein
MSDGLAKRLRDAAYRAKREYPEVFRVSEEIAYEAADRIEKLEAANLQQSLIKVDDMRRIEQLEAALRTIYECCDETGNCSVVRRIARKALDAK